MKISCRRFAIIAMAFGVVVGATPGVEARVYTAYISDGPDTSIAYWLAKEVGLFKKHGLDMELIFIDGSSRATSCRRRPWCGFPGCWPCIRPFRHKPWPS